MVDRDRQLEALAASDDPVEVDRAHQQALARMGREPNMRSVAACAYDRTRALAGRAQKFGTQSVVVGGACGLWPVDPGTTDSERAKWRIDRLAALREQATSAPRVTKANLRRAVRARRGALQAEEIEWFAKSIAEHGAGAVPATSTTIVAAYWPLPGEADPRPLAQSLCQRHGVGLALPVVDGEEITFREWRDDGDLPQAWFGSLGPTPAAAEVVASFVLTPLVGFYASGARLGQGGGFYDRKFAELQGRADLLVVGIASSCQELPVVPTEAHDRRLDLVITELGVTKFRH